MATVPESMYLIGLEYGKMTIELANEICKKFGDYMGQSVCVRDNEEEQQYEFILPHIDVPGVICFYVPSSNHGIITGSVEPAFIDDTMFPASKVGKNRTGQGVSTAHGNNHGQPRPVRLRAANISRNKHIPRPRNSWIIYRSDKTRELRDQDPSLTASDNSRIVSRLWAAERDSVKQYYQLLAVQEANDHRFRYPDYRYRARRAIPRQPKVDAAGFWQSLPNDDVENNDPICVGTRAIVFDTNPTAQ